MNMTSSQHIFSEIANFFGVEVKTDQGFIETKDDVLNTLIKEINCDFATSNRNLLPCSEIRFRLQNIIREPLSFRSLPSGYAEEEFTISVPLPLPGNNSYDHTFVNTAYEIVEPYLKRKHPQYPVFCENKLGTVYLCLMLDINGIYNNSQVDTQSLHFVIDALNILSNEVKETF